jgi:hypothetical protein
MGKSQTDPDFRWDAKLNQLTAIPPLIAAVLNVCEIANALIEPRERLQISELQSDYGQPGSNPQVLVNAVTEEVESTENQMDGNPTTQPSDRRRQQICLPASNRMSFSIN